MDLDFVYLPTTVSTAGDQAKITEGKYITVLGKFG